MNVFTLRAFGTNGMELAVKTFDPEIRAFTVQEVLTAAREIMEADSPLADVIAYVEIWWDGSLVDTFIPEWLKIRDVNVIDDDDADDAHDEIDALYSL